ncbi:MAG: glycosyltransferase family 2 protein [Myxococcota bacterium]
MRPRLSVCVIACDEEHVLPRCLDAIAFADELVVVIDAKSSDRSESIARSRAQRVEVRPYDGDIGQKSACTSLATGDWILVVDPDEVVRPELAREIAARVADDGGGRAGFEIDRLTWHLGRWIRHGDFHPDWTLRLFRRDAHAWQGRDPHGRVAVRGAVGRIRGAGRVIEHYSYRDVADHVARVQRWSAQAARALRAEGRRARAIDLALRPAWRFFRGFVLKRGFLDGLAGLEIASMNAFYVFLKYAKLRELERLERGG